MAGAVSMAILSCAGALARDTTGHDWYAAAKLTVVDLMTGVGFDENALVEFRNADGTVEKVTRSGLTGSYRVRWAREDILEAAWEGATLGALSGVGVPQTSLRPSGGPGRGSDLCRFNRVRCPCRLRREAVPPRLRWPRPPRRLSRRRTDCRSPNLPRLRNRSPPSPGERHWQGQPGGGRPPRAAQPRLRALGLMVAWICAVASPSQGMRCYETDGYYAKDSPEHRNASAWAGRGAAELGFEGPVDPDTFRALLEGKVLGRVDEFMKC